MEKDKTLAQIMSDCDIPDWQDKLMRDKRFTQGQDFIFLGGRRYGYSNHWSDLWRRWKYMQREEENSMKNIKFLVVERIQESKKYRNKLFKRNERYEIDIKDTEKSLKETNAEIDLVSNKIIDLEKELKEIE